VNSDVLCQSERQVTTTDICITHRFHLYRETDPHMIQSKHDWLLKFNGFITDIRQSQGHTSFQAVSLLQLMCICSSGELKSLAENTTVVAVIGKSLTECTSIGQRDYIGVI